MSVVSVEELARKNIYEVGRPRVLNREFVVVLSDDTLTNPTSESGIFTSAGIPDLGDYHPTYTDYRASKITYTEGHEGSPYHTHVSVEYGVILENMFLPPTSRAPVWSFDGALGEVPALYYYEGSGNGTLRPLTNSAYDFFQGLVAQEQMTVGRVTKNFESLPMAWLLAQNCVNDDVFLGAPAHSVKVAKVSIAQAEEEFSGGIVAYWKATAELHYRQSGHNYQLPDVGFNFLDGGQKRRCMVFDAQNVEWVPSPGPVGLNGSGAQTFGAPAILNRRINPVADFQALFGTPPTGPLNV